MAHRLTALLIVLLLAACGQKGDLYLPDRAADQPAATQTDEQTDEQTDTDDDEE